MFEIRYDVLNRWEDERDLVEEAEDREELCDLLAVLASNGGYNFRVLEIASKIA